LKTEKLQTIFQKIQINLDEIKKTEVKK